MTDVAPLYPPAPADVPVGLTRPDIAYRIRVAAMIGGLAVFLLVYLALIALAGLATYYLVITPPLLVRGRGMMYPIIAQYGGALCCAVLCLFLVKGLFKRHTVKRSEYIALREVDHPNLFAFIRRVHQDAGASSPRRVYVSPDVNAALVYDTSLVNLVIPPGKDLLIGLGLVNVVTLAEFKAVLAHEFGHFAQRSVGLGSYLYVANQVMRDIIYGRDGLDQFVDGWASQDLRVSFPAWGLKGILWAVRGGLSLLYRGLNLVHLSLGRQMEYNADNVAVRLAGPDALLHGLARLEFALECLGDAARSLVAAADHGLITDDLFYHQSHSADRLRTLRKNDRLGRPPEPSDDPTRPVTVFEPVDDGIPESYRTHPTEHMRERNARRFNIRSPRDDRSPWLLFGDTGGVKRVATEAFYRHSLGRGEPYDPRPAVEVQEFIDAENSETTYDAKYVGWYDNRVLDPGDVGNLPADPWPRERVTEWLTGWPTADLGERVSAHRMRQVEYEFLRGLKSGEIGLKGKSFPFRGRDCTVLDLGRLLEEVGRELTADLDSVREWDREVFLAHWSAARCLDADGGQRTSELLERYRFQVAIQALLGGLTGDRRHLESLLGYLASRTELDQESFDRVRRTLWEIRETLNTNLEAARETRTPALTNVAGGSDLHSLIVDRSEPRLPEPPEGSISGEWVARLMGGLNGVIFRVERVHFKSLGSLLAFQERVAAEWTSAAVCGGRAAGPDGGA